MKSVSVILTCLILCLTSCDSIMPAGFWADYKDELIKENQSNQGPWGGYRAIHWESLTKDKFTKKDILSYTQEEGWALVDRYKVDQTQLKNWISNDGEKIFPAVLTNFTPVDHGSGSFHDFPRWINKDLYVFKFKTGWFRLYSETDDSTEENGFILLSKDGTQMTVYHLWGE